MKFKSLNIFNDSRIRNLVLLSILSVLLLLFFQYKWLQTSYRVSKQETKNNLTALLDNVVLEYQKHKADSVRDMVKKLVKSEKDFKFKIVSDTSNTHITFSSHSYSKDFVSETYYTEYKLHLPAARFKNSEIQSNPYGVFLQIINAAEFNNLINICESSVVLPKRSYSENSQGYKIHDRLMDICDNPYGDEQAFNTTLQKHLQKNNLHYKAKISCYKHPSEIWASKRSSIFGIRFEQHLEQLQLWLNAKNTNDSIFIAKPILYNDFVPSSLEVPTLLLSSAVTTGQTLGQMRDSIAGTFVLLIILIALLGYMIKLIINQKQLSEIKNDFIANISHELQTPITTSLTAVQGLQYYEILNDPDKTQLYLETVSDELKKMSTLVTKILDSAIYENKQFSISPKQFNLQQAIDNLIKSNPRNNYGDLVNFSYKGDPMVFADPLHLQQSISNLLDNAVKYAAKSSRIILEVVRSATELSIRIKDNGIGIPTAFQSQIFDKFFRVPRPDDHTVKGHGLGLHYAKNIAKAHGGDLVLIQSDKTGSTFQFKIPQ